MPKAGSGSQKAALDGGTCAGVTEKLLRPSWEVPGCGKSPAEITCEITAEPMF